MGTVGSPESTVHLYKTTSGDIPEERNSCTFRLVYFEKRIRDENCYSTEELSVIITLPKS
jgi:hypothetical protein